ncbi:PPC domain-containing protein, partial [Okeania sp.]|uniref:PPC domain-containing protein n=1 Tax=Okeania sp. TaxID=3100323 RepID=UPI002B4B517A
RKNNEYKNKDDIGFTRGVRNTNDFYNFTLDSDSNFTLTLDQLKRDANVMVLDDEGNMVLSGFNPGNAPEFVNGELEAGDYTVQVFPVGAAKTNYFLKMNADPITGGGGGVPDPDPVPEPGEDPDGTLATANDLGNYQMSAQSGAVGFSEDGYDDLNDYYKFTLPAADNVQIVLDDLDQNADLSLLASDGSILYTSSESGIDPEFINVSLDAGDYYLQVTAVGSAQTDYTVQFF